jgi:hypothetical protein
MKARSFIRILILFVLICFRLDIPAHAAPTVNVASRVEQNFSTHWRYTPKDVPGGENPELKDASFEQVSVLMPIS